jgi:hypothetical protein
MTDRSINKPEQEKKEEKNKIKKTYRSPQFEVYGSLTELTNGGAGHAKDGGPATSKATGPG